MNPYLVNLFLLPRCQSLIEWNRGFYLIRRFRAIPNEQLVFDRLVKIAGLLEHFDIDFEEDSQPTELKAELDIC